MHRSQLAGFIIDCETDDLEAAANFWGQALGCSLSRSDDPEDEAYVQLETGPNDLHVEVQRVKHESRLHLDIETDDIEAEVVRLEKLGAKRVDSDPSCSPIKLGGSMKVPFWRPSSSFATSRRTIAWEPRPSTRCGASISTSRPDSSSPSWARADRARARC